MHDKIISVKISRNLFMNHPCLLITPLLNEGTTVSMHNTIDLLKTNQEIIKDYYPNGQLKTEKYHRNGILDGTTKAYYENGELGSERTTHQNGKIKSVLNYKDDRIIRERTYK